MASAEAKTVPFFKKGKSRPTTARKRSLSPSAAAASAEPSTSTSAVVLPSRKAATNLLSAGTKRLASQRDAEYDDDPDAPMRNDGPDVKWSAADSHFAAALDIIAGDEAEALLAKRRRTEGDGDDVELTPDGQYRGQAAYHTHLKAKEVAKAMRVGPTRSTSTIRTVTIVDYQPDVCKDYKETGYCGFGDTCKFLHDRGTYLAGWQLDKLAETAAKQPGDAEDSDSDEEDVPFACLICRKHYTDPIVTRCGHYFCSACAIKRFAKTPKCLACGAPTGGMFNRADKILEKINKKKQEKEERRKKNEGDDAEDGEGGKVEIEGLETKGAEDESEEDEDED